MELANHTFDLVVKIAAILAAVAAISLLAPKPHLTTNSRCHGIVDEGVLVSQYKAAGRTAPRWLLAAVRGFRDAGYAPPSSSSRIGTTHPESAIFQQPSFGVPDSARIFVSIPVPLTQETQCTAVKLNPAAGSLSGYVDLLEHRRFRPEQTGWLTDGQAELFLRRAMPILGRSFVDSISRVKDPGGAIRVRFGDSLQFRLPTFGVDPVARSAVASATQVTADVRVENQGPGGATNVRVEASSPFEPVGEVRPFDLAANESQLLHFAVPEAQTAAAPANPAFTPFGDKKSSVNTRLLVTLGTVLGALALVAFVNDVRALRQKPHE